MAEQEDSGLLAIEVDADDYAETAAGDTPTVPRTYQSEADFQAIRAKYSAKIDGAAGSSTYDDLISAVPVLAAGSEGQSNGAGGKVKMGKKEVQWLGYAVGEMYLERRYGEVVALCERVRARCEVDAKLGESLGRWEGRCRERMLR